MRWMFVLVLLLVGTGVRAAPEPDRLLWFEKTWTVRYLDGALGIVTGRAVVTKQTDPKLAKTCPKKVTVTLTHPATRRTYTLKATAVAWDLRTGVLQVTLKGASPTQRPDDLPAELRRDAIRVKAAPGEKLRASLGFVETAVDVEGTGTETVLLHFKVDRLFQLADGHWTYRSTPEADRRRAVATPEVRGGVEQWMTVQPLENYANLYQWCRALSGRLLAAHEVGKAVEKLESELVPAAQQATRLRTIVKTIKDRRGVLEAFRRDLNERIKYRNARAGLERLVERARAEYTKTKERRQDRDDDIFVYEKGPNVVPGVTADSLSAAKMIEKLRAELVAREKKLREAVKKNLPDADVEKIVEESAVLDPFRRKIKQAEAIRRGDAELARREQAVRQAARLRAAAETEVAVHDRNYRGMTVAAMQARWTRAFLPAYKAIRDMAGREAQLREIKELGLPAYPFPFDKLPPLGGEINETNEQARFRGVEKGVFEVVQLDRLLSLRLAHLDAHVKSRFLRLAGMYEYQLRVVRQALTVRMAASRAAAAAAKILAKKDPGAYGPMMKHLEAFNDSFKKNQEFMSNSKKLVDYMEKGRRALGFKFGKDFVKKSVESMDVFAKYLGNANEIPKAYESYLKIRDDLLNADQNPARALTALERTFGVLGPTSSKAGGFGSALAGGVVKIVAQYIGYLAWGAGRAAKKMNELSDRIIANDLKLVLTDRRKKPELYLFTKNEVRAAMTRASPPAEKVNRVTSYLQLRRLMALLSTKDPFVMKGTRR